MEESKAKTKNQKKAKDDRILCNSYSKNIFKTVIQKINTLELTALLSKWIDKNTT